MVAPRPEPGIGQALGKCFWKYWKAAWRKWHHFEASRAEENLDVFQGDGNGAGSLSDQSLGTGCYHNPLTALYVLGLFPVWRGVWLEVNPPALAP